jgi:hypothetical protein
MKINLETLISQIKTVDGTLKNETNKAVNTLLTIPQLACWILHC